MRVFKWKRRAAWLAVVAGVGLGLSACGESSAVIGTNPTRVAVVDEDGGVDARQIADACTARGDKVDTWSESALDIGDGHMVIVTCRPADQ